MNKTLLLTALCCLAPAGCDPGTTPEPLEAADIEATTGGEEADATSPQQEDEPDDDSAPRPTTDELATSSEAAGPDPSVVYPTITPAPACNNASDCSPHQLCRPIAYNRAVGRRCMDPCDTIADCNEGETCAADGWCDVLRNLDDDFCVNGGCSRGQGDCDSSSDCEGSLICRHNVGTEWGSPNPLTDICDYPEDTLHYCKSPIYTCSHGNGDCDYNTDCEFGLVCKQNVGAQYGMPPGYDVCLWPWE